jgi:hypothetical protein
LLTFQVKNGIRSVFLPQINRNSFKFSRAKSPPS